MAWQDPQYLSFIAAFKDLLEGQDGNKIRMIKLIRDSTGKSLRESKQIFDDIFYAIEGEQKLANIKDDINSLNFTQKQLLLEWING